MPILAGLAFAVRCAQLSRKFFQNDWDEIYDDAVDSAIDISTKVVSTEKGTKINGPDGYADYCADLSRLAHDEGLESCSRAAEAAAGAAYASAMICDFYNGYSNQIGGNFFRNISRSVNSVLEISEINDRVVVEFQNLMSLVEVKDLKEFTPISTDLIQKGFKQ